MCPARLTGMSHIAENCSAAHRIKETAYNITSFTLALQCFSTCTCPYTYTYRRDICDNREWTLALAHHFVCRAFSWCALHQKWGFCIRKWSDHIILTQKFWKLVHFQKYFFENFIVKNSKFYCHKNYPLYGKYFCTQINKYVSMLVIELSPRVCVDQLRKPPGDKTVIKTLELWLVSYKCLDWGGEH